MSNIKANEPLLSKSLYSIFNGQNDVREPYQHVLPDAVETDDALGMAKVGIMEWPEAGSVENSVRFFGKFERDKFAAANKTLQDYVAKHILLPKFCHIFVTEYARRNRHVIPINDKTFVDQMFQPAINFSPLDFNRTPFAQPYLGRRADGNFEYRCIVLIPEALIPPFIDTTTPSNMFNAILWHEVVGHCYNVHPLSDLMQFAAKVFGHFNGNKPAYFKWRHDLDEFCAYLTQLDFMVTKQNLTNNPYVLTVWNVCKKTFLGYVREVVNGLKSEKWSAEHKKLMMQFIRNRVKKVSRETKKFLRKWLHVEHNFDDKSLKLLGL
jgi:hypothetical protein